MFDYSSKSFLWGKNKGPRQSFASQGCTSLQGSLTYYQRLLKSGDIRRKNDWYFNNWACAWQQYAGHGRAFSWTTDIFSDHLARPYQVVLLLFWFDCISGKRGEEKRRFIGLNRKWKVYQQTTGGPRSRCHEVPLSLMQGPRTKWIWSNQKLVSPKPTKHFVRYEEA